MQELHYCETAEEKVSANHPIANTSCGAGLWAMLPVLRLHLGSLKFDAANGVMVDPDLIKDLELRIHALESEGDH